MDIIYGVAHRSATYEGVLMHNIITQNIDGTNTVGSVAQAIMPPSSALSKLHGSQLNDLLPLFPVIIHSNNLLT